MRDDEHPLLHPSVTFIQNPGARLLHSEPYPFLPKLITILLFVAVVPEPVHVCPKGV